MFCRNCGKEMENSCEYCPYCGEKNGNDVTEVVVEKHKETYATRVFKVLLALSIICLVFSIVSLLMTISNCNMSGSGLEIDIDLRRVILVGENSIKVLVTSIIATIAFSYILEKKTR